MNKPLKISEAGTVQFPMVKHAAEIGWTPITPEIAKQKRGGEAGMLLRDELESKLAEFNRWMTKDAIRSVIETLDAIPPAIEGNREMLSWLRGERQWYDENEKRHRRVTLVDFDNTDANVFHVSWEWTLKPPARKGNRADMMFLINGLPVCIVEHKNPKDGDAIERAIKQLRRYEIETPELIGSPQLFNVTHLLDYWYGVTWNATRRFLVRWKQTPEETYRFAVQAFFERTDFLRTLQHWVLFYVEDSETKKSVLRQHQRRAIDAVIERCADPVKDRGLVWHTQGSGKTFTLLTAARLILEQKDRFKNATVILVVDRTELEGQMKGWVEKLLGEMQKQDIATWRANTKAELQDLLKSDKRGLILSMIHKFEGDDKDSNTRDNIYVFIDEAHRSVAKDLGTYLMASVPNATIIGFTGTPIAKTRAGRRHLQDLRHGRRARLPRQVFHCRVHRGRDDTANQARHGAKRDDRACRAAGQGVLRTRGSRGRYRHRRTEQGTRPCCWPAHLPYRGRPRRKGRRLRGRAFQGERAAARLQGISCRA